jgi:hypothetical protein
MIGRLTTTAVCVAAVSVLACGVARAETSSWTSSTMKTPPQRPGEAKILKSDPAKGAAKKPSTDGALAPPGSQSRFQPPVAPQPGTVPKVGGAAPAGAAGNGSSIAKTARGDDAAYEAFDQGKYLTALDLARAAAERGDASAHTLIGRLYQDGLGVAIDPVLAAQWYRRGAELGDVEAMFAFGVMLAEGTGIQKDRAGAAQMFEEAAGRGHVLGNYNLALLYLKGDGKPENAARAALHLQYAADQGIAAAQYDLATLYATGTGVAASAFKASLLLEKAAVAGLPEAEVEFAVWLFQGRGIRPSPSRGASFFRSAAEKGLAVAQNRLARCLSAGAGVAADPIEAAKWHLIAKAGGIEDEVLDKAMAKLSRADRTEAKKRAEEWAEQARVR